MQIPRSLSDLHSDSALSLVGVGGGRSSSPFSQTSSKERERGRCFVGTISRETCGEKNPGFAVTACRMIKPNEGDGSIGIGGC